MRRRVGIDANQPAIIQDLRRIGADVLPLNALGVTGAPDFLVGWRGLNFLFEDKTDKGKLRAEQAQWHLTWPGQVSVIRTFDEALDVMQSATLRRPTDDSLAASVERAIRAIREGGGYGTVSIEVHKGVVRRMGTTISESVTTDGST